MKTFWTLFISGFSVGMLVFAMLRETHASESDPRAPKIDDPSIAGIRVPVPLGAETETALVRREKEIAEREQRVKEEEERLAVEEGRIKIRIDEFQKLQDDIVAAQAKNKQLSGDILGKIVKTYETMAPKKAAGILSVMADDLAVEIMMGMKEKRVASVLEAMDASRAMTLSSLVAKRRPAGRAVGEEKAP